MRGKDYFDHDHCRIAEGKRDTIEGNTRGGSYDS